MELYNFQNILNDKFQCGFEIECCIRRADNALFEQELKKLHKGILFQYDGSIRPLGWSRKKHNSHTYSNRHNLMNLKCDQAHELLTPVLPCVEGFQLLEQIFALVAEFGYVNNSCGFHANFSPKNKKDFNKINPFWLSERPLWSEIRKTFGRNRNKYCQDVVLRKDIRENPANVLKQKIDKSNLDNGVFFDGYRNENVTIDYKHINAVSLWRYMIQLNDFKRFGKQKLVKCHWHYANCNFENLKPIPTKDSRIEIRGFGGADYHLRLDEIIDYCDKAIGLFEESYQKQIKI